MLRGHPVLGGSLAGMGQTHQLLYRAMRIAMFLAQQIRDDFGIGLTAGECAAYAEVRP